MHNINHIYEIVEKETGVNFDALTSRSRNKTLVFARHLFTALARKNFFSYPDIGKALLRDHTTAIHSFLASQETPLIQEIVKRYDIEEKLKDVKKGPISIQLNQKKYGNVYQYYDGKCAVCGFNDVVHVQYLLPPHLGGTESIDNLVLLCPNHKALVEKGMLEIKDINKNQSYTYPNSI